ncbi:MAG: alginate export family protein [Kiritimatiellaeota bacterium]|nr:alginate export family protein [Kiritimatiellota bacterium]
MKRLIGGALLGLSFLVAGGVFAKGWTYEYSEGKECRIGADIRIRMTRFDRNAIWPGDWGVNNGPALEYLRVRERVWGCFDLWADTCLNIRLVNRWHRFGSSPNDPNNQAFAYDDGTGANTWNFPDEVIFDQLNLSFQNVLDSNWSVTLGRQDIVFGNGMVWLEGTPFDQGRTIYFDGVLAKYQQEGDTLSLALVRNGYKDNTLVINDRERNLRLGDIWAAAAYWTHEFSSKVNTDLYYFYVDINDEDPGVLPAVEYNHFADENAELHIVGARVFGSPTEQIDYSIEAAQQYGNRMISTSADVTGSMVDARLALKAAEGTSMNPVLSFEYTYLSGDDPTSNREYEGWHPVFAEYPIWREELIPILNNANWTNLKQLRTQLKLDLSEKVTLTGAWAVLRADYGENGFNAPADDGFGQLLSAFLDVKVTDALAVAFEASAFRPGDYWADGHNSEWLRFQAVYSF